jgi:Peptidase family M1 domain
MAGELGSGSKVRSRLRQCIILLCLVFLVSCTVLPPVTQADPGITPNPSAEATPAGETGEPTLYPTQDPTMVQTALASAFPQVTKDTLPTSTPLPSNNALTSYELEVVFDYYWHTLSVSETISYINYAPQALGDMVLMVEPNRWLGGFSLKSLALGNGEIISKYELDDDQLRFALPQVIAPGGKLGLVISYDLLLPEIPSPSAIERPQPYGYTERQTNIVDWYPYVPPYQPGEGWLVHEHSWFGEHQVFDMAEFQVKLTLAEPVKDLVIAASAPAEQDGDTYTYHLDAGRTFALSASDEYLVQTTQSGEVTITSYSFPYDKYSGQEVLQNTADALKLFSQLIMPYPHSTLSVVEADFLDGMEYEGLYFLSHGFYDLYDGTPKGYLTFIAAHETAHQWWYGLVGNDQALEPWLDEALCTYMEEIFYENIYADYSLESGQSLVDWWWFYRVNFYDPTGAVDGTVYDFSSFYSYRNAVYLNGAKFLSDLRRLVGDQDFFAFLRDYANQYKYKLATGADFFRILREHTDKDMSGLIAEYFQGER